MRTGEQEPATGPNELLRLLNIPDGTTVTLANNAIFNAVMSHRVAVPGSKKEQLAFGLVYAWTAIREALRLAEAEKATEGDE